MHEMISSPYFSSSLPSERHSNRALIDIPAGSGRGPTHLQWLERQPHGESNNNGNITGTFHSSPIRSPLHYDLAGKRPSSSYAYLQQE